MTEERWRELTAWPLLAASVVFLVAYSWRVIADLTGTARGAVLWCLAVTWAVFLADYLVRLVLAERRGAWFVRHLFDLFVVLLPALRPLILLRALTAVRARRSSRGQALRNNLSIVGGGAAVLLLWMATIGVLHAERGAPGANIETFGDAIWWSFVTITTTGYGDLYPVTMTGRAVAVLLMCGGVAIVGVITATLSSWIIERAAGDDDDRAATRGQLRAIAREIDAVLVVARPAPDASASGGPGAAPDPSPSAPEESRP